MKTSKVVSKAPDRGRGKEEEQKFDMRRLRKPNCGWTVKKKPDWVCLGGYATGKISAC